MREAITTEISTLGDLLVRGACDHGGWDALVLPGQRSSYADLYAGALGAARSLAGLGVRRGEHVGILIPNCVEYAQVLLRV